MAVRQLTGDNFEQIVENDGIVMIDCWASWCQGCKQFEPVFLAAADRHPDHTFVKLDTQAESELTEKLTVRHIPTLILFRDGILLLRQPGHAPAEALDEIVEKAAALDMDHVRREMEKEKSSAAAEES
jgi:thioredoxin 1